MQVAHELREDNQSLGRRAEEQERQLKLEREKLEDAHLDLQRQCVAKE
jgi:hypothetical protein